MKKLRPEEEWARQMIHAALAVPVEQHDDGSVPKSHDLNICGPDGTIGAVEVTAAADRASIELWNLMNGRDERWQVDGLRGGWMIHLEPTARANRLKRELPDFLAELERQGISVLDREWRRRDLSEVEISARDLRITRAWQGGTSYPGSIYLTIDEPLDRTGGCVPDTGDPLARWIGNFLRESQQADVLDKLARSQTEARHAFVLVPGFTPAPFAVADLLLRTGAPLPTIPPHLPSEVTHVWIASTWTSGDGFCWFPHDGWARFKKPPRPDRSVAIDEAS